MVDFEDRTIGRAATANGPKPYGGWNKSTPSLRPHAPRSHLRPLPPDILGVHCFPNWFEAQIVSCVPYSFTGFRTANIPVNQQLPMRISNRFRTTHFTCSIAGHNIYIIIITWVLFTWVANINTTNVDIMILL